MEPTWFSRLKVEFTDLNEKLEALNTYLGKLDTGNETAEQTSSRHLLNIKRSAMATYSEVLKVRILSHAGVHNE